MVVGRRQINVFYNALAARVLSPCEAQGVSEMLGCTRAVAAELARIFLWAHGSRLARAMYVIHISILNILLHYRSYCIWEFLVYLSKRRARDS